MRGLAIGLFGGSFNPAHEGHLHMAETAAKACALDRVWWMPSPQNPLKPTQPAWERRAATVSAMRLGPRHVLSDIEVRMGTQYTVDTLRGLARQYPDTRFVFMMGADNFAQLPRWKAWQTLMRSVPVAVVSRPGENAVRARLGRAARQFARARVPETAAGALKYMDAPAWVFLTAPHNRQSSTALRRRMAKP